MFMSEHISVLDERKVITSIASEGKYRLAVYDKDNAPNHFLFMGCDQEYGYEEYCNVLKKLWEDYISKGEKPKLLGLTLSDTGFVTETLHCIAPGAWGYSSPLPQYRESFAYWLKSKSPEIKARIGKKEFECLDRNLEEILQYHIKSKQGVS
jgi:hypothetical protein